MGKKQKSSSTTSTSLAPEQAELLQATNPIFKDYLEQGGAKLPDYSSVAPTDPAQTQGQDQLLSAARGSVPGIAQYLGSAQDFNQRVTSPGFIGGIRNPGLPSRLNPALQPRVAQAGLPGAVGEARGLGAAPTQERIGLAASLRSTPEQERLSTIRGLSLDPNEANPYIEQYAEAATRPFIQNLQENVIPGLAQQGVAGGTFGGSRGQLAQALATRRTAQAGTDALAGIYKDAYDRNLQGLLAQRGQDLTQRGQDLQTALGARGQDVQTRGQDIAQRGQDLQTALGARGQDAQYYATTRGQDVAQRGQGITAVTARRGQDVGQRGQDITQRGQDVSQRGQDITAQTARRGQDVQRYLGELATASQAAGRAPDLAAAQTRASLLPGLIGSQVGQERQRQAQRELTDRYQRELYTQRAPFLAAKDIANIALGGPKTTTTSSTSPGPSPLQTIGGLASLGVTLFSDRRLKTDIRRVGKLFSGLPVYSFRWKETGEAAFGVLADEVAEVIPEAVSQSPDGYLLVDYGKLAA